MCTIHGTDKRACQMDPRCKRSHHRCVRNDEHAASKCASLTKNKKACRRHPDCTLANKRCIAKSHKQVAAFYRGSRVHIIHRSNYDPQHYIIEYANGLRASVPMTEVTSTSQREGDDELLLHQRFIESLARRLQQYQVHDAASARPTCSPGPWGNHFCRRIGVGKCGSDRRCAPQGTGSSACHARCNAQPERTYKQLEAKQNCYRNCAKPKAAVMRWRQAALQKCKERCALQPGRTEQQQDMKRRCYNNCRARQ